MTLKGCLLHHRIDYNVKQYSLTKNVIKMHNITFFKIKPEIWGYLKLYDRFFVHLIRLPTSSKHHKNSSNYQTNAKSFIHPPPFFPQSSLNLPSDILRFSFKSILNIYSKSFYLFSSSLFLFDFLIWLFVFIFFYPI